MPNTPRTRPAAAALALALLLPPLAGCRDLLVEDPKGNLTTENFYQTQGDAVAAIAAAYRPLSDGSLFGTDMKTALIIAADDARSGLSEETASIIALETLTWDAATPRVTNPWFGWYDIITKANLLLEKLPDIQMPEASRAQIGGEAKFLRALGYFYLVRLYGDVPLLVATADQVGQPARTPKEQVYAQIVKDAQEAEAALPLSWDLANKGRAPKGAAQALLADVYLWRSSAERKNEWQLAADAAGRVITGGAFQLEPNFLNAFLPGSQARKEEIFAAQASAATNAPTIRTADIFYPRELGANSSGGFAASVPLLWAVDSSYAPGDYRREVTYRTSATNSAGKVVTFAATAYKYRPTTRPGPQDVNWPIYRYAEVLLFEAEALNELGRTGEAVAYLNQVRARARNGTGAEKRAQPANYAGPLTQAAFRDTLFEERRLELAFESKRWFDIVRRGPDFFLKALSRDKLVLDAKPSRMVWPIPQREIDVNPNLTQNPGY